MDIKYLLKLYLDYDKLNQEQIQTYLSRGCWWIKTPQGHSFWKKQHDEAVLSKEGKKIIRLTLEKYGYIKPSLKKMLEEIK